MGYRIAWGPSKSPPPDAVVAQSWWPPWGSRFDCGHRGPKTFTVRVRGAIVQPRPGDRFRCPACVIAHIRDGSITCPLCEQPLFPGSLIQPFQDMPPGPLPRSALAGLKLGCLRMGCGMDPDPAQLWTWDGELLQPP